MRNDRQFQQVLDAASRAAAENSRQAARGTDAFMERYGVTHSDVDADHIIEALDYQGRKITAAECDREMASAGHPRR
ncbi:MAG: hypothetical protein IIB28_11430 [Chloroflexi bacterium]|nr:hypothetical protein [Chloroflexota bacterium]